MKYLALTRLWEKAQWRDENGLLHTEWWDEGAVMDYPADFPPDYPQDKIDILLDLGRIAPVEAQSGIALVGETGPELVALPDVAHP